MRILQVIPYFTPKRGGSVSVARNLSTQLARRGHRVTILTSDFELDPDYVKEAEEERVTVVSFRCVMNKSMFLFTPRMKKWLNRHIADYDLIHVHNFRSYQSNIVMTIARSRGVPYLLQAHGSIPMITREMALPKKLYDLTWGRRILDGACLLIAVSEVEAEQITGIGIESDKIAVIPNALQTEKFANLSNEGSFRRRLAIEDRRIILYVGRILKAKKIDVLIRSFEIAAKAVEDAVLIIAGPDEDYRQNLEDLVRTFRLEDRVIFLDYLDDVAEAYQDADVLVNPASTEIFGLVPFEATMCGTPVIVSIESGCGRIMKDARCGYAIDTMNVSQLANTIVNALANPKQGAILAERGKEFIAGNLEWNKIVQRYELAYEDCIRNL